MSRWVKVVVGIVLVLIIVAGVVFVGAPMVEERFVWVAVAQVNLSPGMRVGDGLVGLRMWNVDAVPTGAIHTLEEIREMYARENIARGEPVLLSRLTAVAPPPVRTISRQGYILLEIAVHKSDVVNLFVGDMVDVTVIPVKENADGSVSKMRPLTVRKGWLVHHIKYGVEDIFGTRREIVILEIKGGEWSAALGGRSHFVPAHMVRSTLSRD